MENVYILQHSYEDGSHEDTKLIGVYSRRELAELAIQELSAKSGFSNYPGGFTIDVYHLDQNHWVEGFGV